MWKEALCKRKQGKCPLEPGEVALILKGMGYNEETQIYVASGPVHGGETRMRPLRNLYPNLVREFQYAFEKRRIKVAVHMNLFT